MRRIITTAIILFAVFSFNAGPVLAQPPTRAHVRQYLRIFHRARHNFGAHAVGCNLIEKRGHCHRKATDATIKKSIAVLERFYIPIQPTTPSTQTTTQAVSNYTSTNTSTSAIATSTPSSGRYCGAYQFDQSTWSSIGYPGSPCGAPPALQDAAALKLHQLRGDKPWPHCGHYWSQGAAAVRQCENSGSYN